MAQSSKQRKRSSSAGQQAPKRREPEEELREIEARMYQMLVERRERGRYEEIKALKDMAEVELDLLFM